MRLSIETVLSDIGADAIKLGMLANEDIIRAVAACLPAGVPVVLDPVMVATSGACLLYTSGSATVCRRHPSTWWYPRRHSSKP